MQAFETLSLFTTARFVLSVMPLATKNVSEALVSVRRIQAFLELPEVDEDDLPVVVVDDGAAAGVGSDEAAGCSEKKSKREPWASRLSRLCAGNDGAPAPGVVLEARAASFAWPATGAGGDAGGPAAARPARSACCGLFRRSAAASAGSRTPQPNSSESPAATLRDVVLSDPAATPTPTAAGGPGGSRSGVFGADLVVRAGECVCVVGSVGSGKSSLLSAIMGQLQRVSGAFVVRGLIAYAPQQAWVFNGTIRENVLFGQAFDAERYATALRVCALGPDLALLPAGDETEIGERGLNLSGGQKARVQVR